LEVQIRFLLSRDDELHRRGYYVVAQALKDTGAEIILGECQTPREIAKTALDEDVNIIGYRIMQGAPKVLVPLLVERMQENKIEDIPIVLGGIIPKRDIPFLKEYGVKEIFHPHTPVAHIQQNIMKIASDYRN